MLLQDDKTVRNQEIMIAERQGLDGAGAAAAAAASMPHAAVPLVARSSQTFLVRTSLSPPTRQFGGYM